MSSISSRSRGPSSPSVNVLQSNSTYRPRVVIVGAGMSGLSAARHLSNAASDRFNITILEASERAGGRICSASVSGELVEMGATWIHGIEGSPIYEIAQRMHLMSGNSPWECMDGFPEPATVIAEGGLVVPSHTVNAIGDLYKKLYSEIQFTDGGLQQFSHCNSSIPTEEFKELRKKMEGASVGKYLWEGFRMYAALADKAVLNGFHSNGNGVARQNWPPLWTHEALREGVFRMRENVERSVTAAGSMSELDMESNDKYWEYPGDHKTIGHGYSSIVQYLVASLPEKVIEYRKQVIRMAWLNEAGPVRIHCLDGTSYEADHVIITVSLGVLKSEASSAHNSTPSQLDKLFYPPLPPWKLGAISRLGFGVVDKCFLSMRPSVEGATYPHVQLVFRQDYPHDKASPPHAVPWWMRKNFSFYPVHSRSHVVCTWLTGEEAMEMESLSDEEIVGGMVRTMKAFGYTERANDVCGGCGHDGKEVQEKSSSVNAGNPVVEGIVRSQWGSNPLFRGSYSYVAVGSSGKDIDMLAEPLPRAQSNSTSTGTGTGTGTGTAVALDHQPLQLLFAGEATHRHCYSTTHGAFLSGVREAERLMKHYGLASAISDSH